MATSRPKVQKIYLYASVREGKFEGTSIFTLKLDHTVSDYDKSLAWIFVREIEVDTSVPEGFDPRPQAVAAFEEAIAATREKFNNSVAFFNDQIGKCLALPSPTALNDEEVDDDIPF